jgi:ABC-type antimicrobial peptide transport system permease subunit
MTLIVRSPQPAGLADMIRREIQEQDPDLAITNVRSFEDLLRLEIAPRKRAASILGTVCGIGMLLSAVGLYGVIAFGVRERTREFGLRIALGARPRQVLKEVLGRGLRLAMIGGGIGLAGALGFARILTSVLVDVAPLDVMALSITGAVLVAVALVASYFPARWATQVDPADALRRE